MTLSSAENSFSARAWQYTAICASREFHMKFRKTPRCNTLIPRERSKKHNEYSAQNVRRNVRKFFSRAFPPSASTGALTFFNFSCAFFSSSLYLILPETRVLFSRTSSEEIVEERERERESFTRVASASAPAIRLRSAVGQVLLILQQRTCGPDDREIEQDWQRVRETE